jgi:hypothetical protein
MSTQLKMADHNYHAVVSVSETALAKLVGQTLATACIEGGTQALVPIYGVLYPPLVAALLDADPDFDQRRFAAEVDAAEESYLNAAMGDKTGLRTASVVPTDDLSTTLR